MCVDRGGAHGVSRVRLGDVGRIQSGSVFGLADQPVLREKNDNNRSGRCDPRLVISQFSICDTLSDDILRVVWARSIWVLTRNFAVTKRDLIYSCNILRRKDYELKYDVRQDE